MISMNLYHNSIIVVFMCFLSFFANAQGASKPSVKVSGEVTKPLILYADDISKMQRSNVTMMDRDGKEHICTGVAI